MLKTIVLFIMLFGLVTAELEVRGYAMNKIFLPIVEKYDPNYFTKVGVEHCEPNAGITYVNGYTYDEKGVSPLNSQRVVFSTRDGGPIIAEQTSGPHLGYPQWPNGFFSHILGAHGPREGNWSFWIIDRAGQRISEYVHLHTDGVSGDGKCQQALIFFAKR